LWSPVLLRDVYIMMIVCQSQIIWQIVQKLSTLTSEAFEAECDCSVLWQIDCVSLSTAVFIIFCFEGVIINQGEHTVVQRRTHSWGSIH
jgi:hypothetical protein